MKTTHEATAIVVSSLTRDLLIWLEHTPRTYAETMEAWRSSCPRFTVWEDALAEGLVRVKPSKGTALSRTAVVLTARGRAAISGDTSRSA